MSIRGREYWGVVRPLAIVSGAMGLGATVSALLGALLNVVQPWSGPKGGIGPLLISAGISGAVSLYLFLLEKRRRLQGTPTAFGRRQATLAVGVTWVWAGLLGALPLYLGTKLSFPSAVFESISGLTTTGSTVVGDIEGTLSRPLLLWRSLLQWLGGMGIVVLFVAIFPGVGIGGKHMMKGELPGTRAEALRPRIADTAAVLWKLYVGLTVVAAIVYWALGMNFFEASCHAFTTLSTGGFSTRDASIGGFDSAAIEVASSAFMVLSGVNYSIYFSMLRGGGRGDRGRRWRVLRHNTELKYYFSIVLLSTLILAFLTHHTDNDTTEESLRHAFFVVATSVSSTGYGADDYMAYPPPALLIVIALMAIGGCAGSTAGGLKVERVVALGKQAAYQIYKFFRPNLVRVVRMDGQGVAPAIFSDIVALVAIYFITMLTGLFYLTLAEAVSLPTGFGAMLTCLSNMGPAPFYDGADNFAAYSDPTKLVLAMVMLLGRLEFFTLLALFTPVFWRR